MAWLDEWRARKLSAADAVQLVESGMSVGFGHAPCHPPTLQRALVRRRDELKDVRVGALTGDGDVMNAYCSPESQGHFDPWAIHVMPALTDAYKERRFDVRQPSTGLYPRLAQ